MIGATPRPASWKATDESYELKQYRRLSHFIIYQDYTHLKNQKRKKNTLSWLSHTTISCQDLPKTSERVCWSDQGRLVRPFAEGKTFWAVCHLCGVVLSRAGTFPPLLFSCKSGPNRVFRHCFLNTIVIGDTIRRRPRGPVVLKRLQSSRNRESRWAAHMWNFT